MHPAPECSIIEMQGTANISVKGIEIMKKKKVLSFATALILSVTGVLHGTVPSAAAQTDPAADPYCSTILNAHT